MLGKAFSIIWGISLLCAGPAYSWGEKGHDIVAYITEANLTAPAREQVRSLLAKESLAEASYWPDRLRLEMREMDSLHYINLPPDATSYDRQRDCPDRNCIVEALPWFIRILGAEDTPKNGRRIALRFVAHLVGDIHQPLHAGYLENRGGNTIRVTFRGNETNLHSLWDRGLLETDQRSAQEIARSLNQAITRQEKDAWESGDSATWVLESLELARSHAFKVPPTGEISEEYTKDSLAIIYRRLSQAGVRLAWTLNGLFK